MAGMMRRPAALLGAACELQYAAAVLRPAPTARLYLYSE